MNGTDAPPPIAAGWTFCDEDAERAREHGGALHRRLLAHRRRATTSSSASTSSKTKGYEYYGHMSEMVTTHGRPTAMTEFFLDLQVWGTPEQCYEKIIDIRTRVGAEPFIGVFSYAGMPYDEAERSMRLFADEVRPALVKVGDATPALSPTS